MKYNSHGKFLLTGEYLVLRGALAVALPLKLGQSLEVEELETNNNCLLWEAYRPERKWFSVCLERTTLRIKKTDDDLKAQKLSEILIAVKTLAPNVFNRNDLHIVTRLDFDPEWGFGSSSTLVANLAQWAAINPYELLRMTFGGSGYDIACATAEKPIFYQLNPAMAEHGRSIEGPTNNPLATTIDFHPPFAENLYFVYQGKKQISSKEVKAFLGKTNPTDLHNDIETVSKISRDMAKCQNFDDFCELMHRHESIIARCIGQEPIQQRFPDFEGSLKSLGAWGGDFFLAATHWPENQLRTYFQEKGLKVIFGYNALVL